MNGLIELLNESTPIYPPFGRLIVVVALFALAWLASRLAGRAAAFLVDRSERRSALGADHVDTGVLTALKQRETAISLIQTSVTYLVFAIALVLSLMTLTGARRVETVVGASFLAVVLAFSAQRFLTDIIAGLLMFFEGWFRVGDTVRIEPWEAEGVVEKVSLRSIEVRSLSGEVIRVHNSEVKAVRVHPRGFREFEAELYVSDLDEARRLLERVARIVPLGVGHFVRRPLVDETEELDDELVRIRVRAAVAPGREWLAQDFLPSLIAERAAEGLVLHGPVVTAVDDQATRRFARASWTGTRRRAA
ncbi:MAG TPA: mechanosensitive ion channel family protein [Gaiellaceae bacterium]|nr:mechanosensitive ion channel family protein [Gaiellaceae bacterium]